MKYGPVPSALCEILKNNEEPEIFSPLYSDGKEKGFFKPLKSEDLDELSETDVEALNYSLSVYKDKNFNELTDLSHKSAWKSAWDCGQNTSIRIDEILKEIDANEILRNFVKEDLSFRKALL